MDSLYILKRTATAIKSGRYGNRAKPFDMTNNLK